VCAARRTALVVAVLLVTATAGHDGARASVPAGFADEHVATVVRATALAFTPDGRMLTPGKDGPLYLTRPGGSPQVALDIAPQVCFDSERGLLGVAIDPLFSQNRFIYLYYTYKKFGTCPSNTATSPVNRVSRFVLPDTDVVDPASETVLVDNIPSPDGIHNAGDLGFGADGYLYASVGDGGCDFRGDSGCFLLNDAARDLGGLSGKVLRITRDGATPPDNPFVGGRGVPCRLTGSTDGNRRCTEIYASGLRNPFRFASDPGSNRINVNDVGAARWEEIDRLASGADFGWNVREGPCARDSATNCGAPPAGMTNPIHSYSHDTGCTSITAGAFVPAGVWPAEHDGRYIFGDLVCGKLFELTEQPAGAQEFAGDLGNVIDATFGPHGATQALYYITWGDYPNDQVRRIAYVGSGNRAPEAVADGSPRAGSVPLTVQFSGAGSTDADGDPLSYTWDFGDGSPTQAGSEVSHTYTQSGTFTATLQVTDGRGGEDIATVRVRPGSEPPAVSISSPAAGQRFTVGETIALSGSASDPEDGPLPADALSWRVVRHHDTHTHPFLPPTPGDPPVEIQGPAPEDIHATAGSYLEVFLTATDSDGLTTTVTRDLHPRLVDLTFETEPAGLTLEVAGSPVTGPTTVTSWEGWQIPVTASDQTDSEGSGVTFVSWSDGGTATHDITTPAAPATYTARFTRSYARPQGATPARFPLVIAYRECTDPDRVHGPALEQGSCASPEPASGNVTTGTPDANGRAANLIGMVRFGVRPGDPATPADEGDVTLNVTVSDVRESFTLADYPGELELVMTARITDMLNGASGPEAATVQDQALRTAVPCVLTTDLQAGSTCDVSTTLDALVPGIVVERSRAIWELGQAVLNDGGPDADAGTTGGNEPFAIQGIFIP
jgi:glucose/arabinose dehydrogenase/PKD repeat protein